MQIINKLKINILYIIILIIICINILLAVRLREKTIEAVECSEALFKAQKIIWIGLSELPELIMPTSEGKDISIGKNKTALTILVFIKTSDCPPCLSKLSNLNNVTARKSVPVYGISLVKEKSFYTELKRVYKLSFPFLIDEKGTLFSGFSKNVSTPFVLYVNSQLEILDYDFGSDVTSQEYIMKKIENLL